MDTGQVAFRHGGGHVGDSAHLSGQVVGQLIHVVGEIAPGAGGTRHTCLAAQFSFDTDLAGHGGDLIGEGRQRIDHAVDGVGEFARFRLWFRARIYA